MAKQVTATQLKAKVLALLDDVESGEEIVVTRHGLTIARIIPARGPHAFLGKFEGVVKSTAKDDDLYSTGLRWDIEA